MIATFRPALLIAALLSAFALLSACSKKSSSSPEPLPNAPPPPGSRDDGPVVEKVDYENIDYDGRIFSKDGKPFTGRTVQYYEDGTLKSDWQIAEGQLDGEAKEFYENGQRSTLKTYRGGLRHGITVYWDEEGELIKKVLYKDDEEMQTVTGEELNPGETP